MRDVDFKNANIFPSSKCWVYYTHVMLTVLLRQLQRGSLLVSRMENNIVISVGHCNRFELDQIFVDLQVSEVSSQLHCLKGFAVLKEKT